MLLSDLWQRYILSHNLYCFCCFISYICVGGWTRLQNLPEVVPMYWQLLTLLLYKHIISTSVVKLYRVAWTKQYNLTYDIRESKEIYCKSALLRSGYKGNVTSVNKRHIDTPSHILRCMYCNCIHKHGRGCAMSSSHYFIIQLIKILFSAQ